MKHRFLSLGQKEDPRPSGQSAGVVDHRNSIVEAEEKKKIDKYVDQLQEKIGMTSEQREYAAEVAMAIYYDGRRNGFAR